MDLVERLRANAADAGEGAFGVLLWGSFARGEPTYRSDVDVCIVAGPDRDPQDALHHAWRHLPSEVDGHRTDVRVFEQLPRYLQGAVIEDHETLWSPDEPALYEYLYPFRRLWEHERHRHTLTRDEARGLLEGPG